MQALRSIANRLQKDILLKEVFDGNGDLQDEEALHKILNIPFVKIIVCNVKEWVVLYVNEAFSEITDMQPGLVGLKEQMKLFSYLEPSSNMYFMSVHSHFKDGGKDIMSGSLSLVSKDNTFVYSDCSAIHIATDESGDVTYFMHLIAELKDLPMLNAHMLYELDKLTARQLQALQLLLTGEGYSDIASKMNISEKTLEKYTKAIFDLTGCHHQMELINACSSAF